MVKKVVTDVLSLNMSFIAWFDVNPAFSHTKIIILILLGHFLIHDFKCNFYIFIFMHLQSFQKWIITE